MVWMHVTTDVTRCVTTQRTGLDEVGVLVSILIVRGASQRLLPVGMALGDAAEWGGVVTFAVRGPGVKAGSQVDRAEPVAVAAAAPKDQKVLLADRRPNAGQQVQ